MQDDILKNIDEKGVTEDPIYRSIQSQTELEKKNLEDLKKRCSFNSTTFVQGDSHDTAFREGQRAVVLFINNMLNKKEK